LTLAKQEFLNEISMFLRFVCKSLDEISYLLFILRTMEGYARELVIVKRPGLLTEIFHYIN